jgi:CRISPR/Cas system-associated protein Csm6
VTEQERQDQRQDQRQDRQDQRQDRQEKRADALADRLTSVAKMLETAVAELNDLMEGIKTQDTQQGGKPEW